MSYQSRMITFDILRFDPQLSQNSPQLERYQLDETQGMTIFIALNRIREEQDPSLQFDFVCRAGICGSCAMVINGIPSLACRTLTAEFSDAYIKLLPLPGFELIGDLSVNTGKFMRSLSSRLRTWLHSTENEINIHGLEKPIEPEEATEVYELERCIECGICVSSCATKQMRDTFVSAVGMMKLARFEKDSKDSRTIDDYYHLIGDQDGVFGCMTLLGCQDNCPKNLPHITQIAYLRRKMAKTIFMTKDC